MEDPSGRDDDYLDAEPDATLIPRSSGDFSAIVAKPVNRMSLEAQRHSADYYLGEYLDLHPKIWSNLITLVSKSENGRELSLPDTLVHDVWQSVVTRDQLQSDLIVMAAQLETLKKQAIGKASMSITLSVTLASIAPLSIEAYHPELVPRYLKLFFWVVFSASSIKTIYSSLGLALVLWLKRRTVGTQKKLEGNELREGNRKDLYGWVWSVIQFSDVF